MIADLKYLSDEGAETLKTLLKISNVDFQEVEPKKFKIRDLHMENEVDRMVSNLLDWTFL